MPRSLAVALAVLLPLAAQAQSGGVAGTVRFEGAPPKPVMLPVTKDNAICGKEKTAEFLQLGPGQGVRNAVVSLVGVPGAARPAPVQTFMDQKTCQYTPHVQALPVGSTLELRSSDNVLHNVHGYRQGNTLFNVAMPLPTLKIKKILNAVGMSWFRCDAGHVWMSAYAWTFDHPYYAVTDASGQFSIKNVPAGTYKLVVWHEGWRQKPGSGSALDTLAVTQEQPVTVEAGKDAAVTLVLK